MSEQLALDLEERVEAERTVRKTARQELSADLVATLRRELEDAEENRSEYHAPIMADTKPRVAELAGHRAGYVEALRLALRLAGDVAESVEDYVRSDASRTHLTLTEVEVEHARHVDVCAVCRDMGRDTGRLERERLRLETARVELLTVADTLRGKRVTSDTKDTVETAARGIQKFAAKQADRIVRALARGGDDR